MSSQICIEIIFFWAADRLMMGEIRDEESVDALMRLSSSGHRAISTLHTNSVCEVPTLRSRQNQPSASVNLPKHFAGAIPTFS